MAFRFPGLKPALPPRRLIWMRGFWAANWSIFSEMFGSLLSSPMMICSLSEG